MNSSTLSRGAAMRALLSLAIGSFGIGMTEFVVMGLLPQISADLLPGVWASSHERAIADTGMLISLYALGVVIGAPTISGFAARFPRHRVMLVLAAALAVGNFLTVIAPTFEAVAVTRFLAGLPHGAYFGIGALVAADIMGPGRRGKGVAFVLSGLTIANIVGVPLGTYLGQQFGWRIAYALVTLIFVLAVVAIALCVPPDPGQPGRRFRDELRVFRIRQVWLALATGAVGFGGFFAVYSYVSPLVTNVAGAPEAAVPIVLVLIGVGMTIGNIVGGHLADTGVLRAMWIGFVALAVALALLGLVAQWIFALAVVVLLVGATSSLTSPTVQTRLMDVARDNQSIAAALNHSSFNIGNSLGAFLGGLVIAGGWGYLAPTWVGFGLALGGLALVAVIIRTDARDRAAA